MVDELVETIAAESEADEEDIRQRIADKVKELSGLVSEEGAAHLIAREEGVELVDAEARDLKIEHIVPGMNSVDIVAEVVDITDVNTFTRDDGEDGKVCNLVLADETGSIRMSLWDEQVEITEKVDVGDVISISSAYSKQDNRDNAELRIGNTTTIEAVDEEIDAVTPDRGGGSSGGYTRKQVNEVVSEGQYCEVRGTIVEVYADSPFYEACPECGKSVSDDDGEWTCDEHGAVDPQHNLILNAILDDGYGNIRTVFFTDRAKALLQASDVDFDGDADAVKEHAEGVKGAEVVIQGQSRYNDFFDRVELIGDDVTFLDTDTLLDEQVDAVMDA